jgi:hypothetical protein
MIVGGSLRPSLFKGTPVRVALCAGYAVHMTRQNFFVGAVRGLLRTGVTLRINNELVAGYIG